MRRDCILEESNERAKTVISVLKRNVERGGGKGLSLLGFRSGFCVEMAEEKKRKSSEERSEGEDRTETIKTRETCK